MRNPVLIFKEVKKNVRIESRIVFNQLDIMGQAASRQEAFWEACGFGHKDRVKKFLEEGDVDVNWVSYTVRPKH